MTNTRPLHALLVLIASVAIGCSSAAPTPTPTQAPATPTPPPVSTDSPTAIPGTPPPTASPAPTATPDPTPTVAPTPTPPATPTEPAGTPTPPRPITPDTGTAAELGPELQAALDREREARNIPGIGAAVIFDDGSIWTAGSGAARIEPPASATGDTPFVVGSITKTFVAAAIMQLVDEGRLSLDDPLSSWLPGYPNAANISVRDLLSHRSGIYNYFEHPQYDAMVFGSRRGHTWTPQEIVDTFQRDPYFAPGTDYHYSNTNFILLGLILEQTTGQSVGQVLNERFLTPLGLEDTYFQTEMTPPPGGESAIGYILRTSGFKSVEDDTDYLPTISAASVAGAAGAIASSARDIAVWGDALYGGHVVSPRSLAEMTAWTAYPDVDETYGLGTRSRVIEGERVFGHTGSLRGYVAAMWHFPESNMTIVTLSNRGRIDANPIVDALAAVAHPSATARLAAIAIGAALPSRGAGSVVSQAVANDAELRSVLNTERTRLHIPGAAAAVIFPDGTVWKAGSGLAQIGPNRSATGKTPFVGGSITKTFVAAAVMQLVEGGQLALDDPLSNWLPDYPRANQITLRHLLSHTSGVYNYFEHPTYNKRIFKTAKDHFWTPDEILDDFVGAPYFAPGAGFHYSNTGYILLGLVIEAQLGQPIDTILRQRFFVPLGLKKTYFQYASPAPASSARGYLYKSGTWQEWSDATNYRPTISAASVAWAAGGVVSSARDIAKWTRALYGGQILTAESIEAMTGTDYAPGKQVYGLGTHTRTSNGMTAVGHTGSLRGFDATTWYFPESGLTVSVMTNLGRVDINPIADALAEAALN